jgi:hypothetical protein
MRSLAEDEFAVRFREKELEGWCTREVTVREGTVDLLFLDGRYGWALPPGKHTLGSLWQTVLRRGPKMEVVRVRSGEVALGFTLPDLLTADPLLLELECSAVLQLQRGAEHLLYTNLMQEKERLTLLHLRALVFQPLRDAASTWFGQWTLERLVANPSLADLALTAEEAVRQGLTGKGLRVVRVVPSNPFCAAWDDKTRRLAQGLYDAWQAEAEEKLERRKRWDKVKQATELQAILKETTALASLQKRADLRPRLGQAFNTAEISRTAEQERDTHAPERPPQGISDQELDKINDQVHRALATLGQLRDWKQGWQEQADQQKSAKIEGQVRRGRGTLHNLRTSEPGGTKD